MSELIPLGQKHITLFSIEFSVQGSSNTGRFDGMKIPSFFYLFILPDLLRLSLTFILWYIVRTRFTTFNYPPLIPRGPSGNKYPSTDQKGFRPLLDLRFGSQLYLEG